MNTIAILAIIAIALGAMSVISFEANVAYALQQSQQVCSGISNCPSTQTSFHR